MSKEQNLLNIEEMDSLEILKRYSQIEYLSTTDKKWYKLKDYYPFAFPIKGEDEAVVLDTGGESGDFGHFKITGGKLLRKVFFPGGDQWEAVTNIRVIDGITTSPEPKPGIIAVGEPFVIERAK